MNNISSTIDLDLWYTGTAKTYPQLYFGFNTATGVSSVVLTLWDYQISINETISAGDVLVVDCEEKTVKLNDVLKEYDWVFFPLEYWANAINIAVNWTFDYDLTYVYNKKRL